jgi:hypothetical protein
MVPAQNPTLLGLLRWTTWKGYPNTIFGVSKVWRHFNFLSAKSVRCIPNSVFPTLDALTSPTSTYFKICVCLFVWKWVCHNSPKPRGPLPNRGGPFLCIFEAPKGPRWDIVHVCHFTIFTPMEQKLLNLEWFLFLEIKWKFQMIFSQLGCIRTLEVKPTFYLNSMTISDKIKVDLALASIVFLCIDNWRRGISPWIWSPMVGSPASPQRRQNKSSMSINFCCRKSQSEFKVQIMPFVTTLCDIIFQWWSYILITV